MISRRFFVMGTAAVVAAAATPSYVQAIEPATIEVVRVPTRPKVIRRTLVDIFANSEHEPDARSNLLQLLRPDAGGADQVLLMNLSFGPGGTVRWVAAPGEGIILDPERNALAYLDWQNTPQFGAARLIFIDEYDDGTAIPVSQGFDIACGVQLIGAPVDLSPLRDRLSPVRDQAKALAYKRHLAKWI